MIARGRSRWRAALGALLLFSAGFGQAYESKLHQEITFAAARQFNECLHQFGSTLPRLTPLDVRYLVKSNVRQARGNPFVRMFRWNYYDRSEHDSRRLLWLVDRRFHAHFDDVVMRLDDEQDKYERLKYVGQLVSYIQDVTSPAHAVPVYTPRFWRLSFGDRFDGYRVDQDDLTVAAAATCAEAFAPAENYEEILRETALDTLAAVRRPMAGLPATWEAFWEIDDDAGSFGEYGVAGNSYGRPVEFPCGAEQRCVLLRDDPLYHQFALDRHLAAVRGTMRAMLLWHQRQHPELKDLVVDALAREARAGPHQGNPAYPVN